MDKNMSATNDIPCIELPNPKSMKIRLPLGGTLSSVFDISKGPPADCTLIHGLMLQLAPALAGIECFLKLLNVITALQKINLTDPKTITEIINAAAKFTDTCLPQPLHFACTILDIVKLIIAYLKCIIEAVESVLKFQVGIDFNAANGNPVFKASLDCSRNNSDASMAQIKEALEGIKAILSLIDPVLKVAEPVLVGPVKDALKIIPETLTTLEQILGGSVAVGVPGTKDALKTLDEIRNTLTNIQQVLDAVPC